MKKLYILKFIFTLLFVGMFLFQTNAQIRIVQVDPATDTVTIHNYGGSPVDISSYWFCSLFSYIQLDDAGLTVTGSLNLNATTDVTISGFGLNNSNADLGLYNTNSFTSTTAMQDFTQWGSSPNGRESVAVSKGIWSAGDFITAPAPYEYFGNGAETGLSFWRTVLGIENFLLKGFSISPNPARSSLLIKLPDGLDKVRVEVFDVLGKEIYNNVFTKAPINISDWSNGVYFVRVFSDKAVHTKRFIKQ